mmetsp:Transcript_6947/g.17634  ORF Transcript_6947/g.17634 Transcript_6947/m.17634 type:complete len:416 (+) Transcript_6947:151-1398(+)
MAENGEGEQLSLPEGVGEVVEMDAEAVQEALDKGDLVILDENEVDREEGDEERQEMEGEAMEEGAVEVEDMACAHFDAHEAPVYSVALGKTEKNSSIVLTGGGDDKVILWDMKDESGCKIFDEFEESVNAVSFSSDGAYFAAGSLDGVVRVYDTEKRELVGSLDGPSGDVEWMQWHPKGPVLAAGYGDATMWLWNAQKQQCMNVFSGHDDSVSVGGFTADGKSLVSGSLDASVRVWDPKTGQCTHTIMGRTFHQRSIIAMHLYPDITQQLALTGGEDAAVCVSHFGTGKIIGKLQHHKDSVTSVHFIAGQPFASSGCVDGMVVVWDLNTMKARQVFNHEGGVTALQTHAAHPSLLFSGGVDGAVRVWDVRTNDVEPQRVYTGHLDAILAMDISEDGNYLVTCSDDRTARLFDLKE